MIAERLENLLLPLTIPFREVASLVFLATRSCEWKLHREFLLF